MAASQAKNASKTGLMILRSLVREIRQALPEKKVSETLPLQYILTQYRRHQLTDKRVCRGEKELQFLAQTYLCYLQSHRKHKELHETYHAKGERSIEESAQLVGLGLPKKWNDPDK